MCAGCATGAVLADMLHLFHMWTYGVACLDHSRLRRVISSPPDEAATHSKSGRQDVMQHCCTNGWLACRKCLVIQRIRFQLLLLCRLLLPVQTRCVMSSWRPMATSTYSHSHIWSGQVCSGAIYATAQQQQQQQCTMSNSIAWHSSGQCHLVFCRMHRHTASNHTYMQPATQLACVLPCHPGVTSGLF